MHRVEAVAQGGDKESNGAGGQNIVARADLQTQRTVDVFIEIAAMGVQQGAALNRQEKQGEEQHKVLTSTSS
tara:strand:+ start:20910 stop:21125 length:216 start_codon:yes stop_codon:yes gene_type:complete